jgi:uncharacterized alkaline shock family protein YloU
MNEFDGFGMDDTLSDLGKVEISPEVIEVIANIASSEVDGVASLRGNFAIGVAERLGRKSHSKGVKVELAEEGILIDIFVYMKYGTSIPVVAKRIQENIRQALWTMTALEPAQVNVHVVGINFEQAPEQVEEHV